MSLYTKSYHMYGLKGIYIVLCSYAFRKAFFSVRIPRFGLLKSYFEMINFADNFCSGELRCQEIESYIQSLRQPVIVDLGINIGITTRWWFSLNPNSTVIGIDMMQEALDYTTRQMQEMDSEHSTHLNWIPICNGVGAKAENIEIRIDNPLEGTNSLETKAGGKSRTIQVDTLDSLLKNHNLSRIHLLKIDIEGYAPQALKGAIETLKKVDYISVESHHRNEVVEVSEILASHGFYYFWVNGRTMWYTSKKEL